MLINWRKLRLSTTDFFAMAEPRFTAQLVAICFWNGFALHEKDHTTGVPWLKQLATLELPTTVRITFGPGVRKLLLLFSVSWGSLKFAGPLSFRLCFRHASLTSLAPMNSRSIAHHRWNYYQPDTRHWIALETEANLRPRVPVGRSSPESFVCFFCSRTCGESSAKTSSRL